MDNPLCSYSTIEKVNAARQFIENYYHTQMKNIQDRKQRRLQLESELASSETSDEVGANLIKDLERNETLFMRLTRSRISVNDFHCLKIIGRGAFGEVHLCREKKSGSLYAMKKLKKSETIRRGQVENAWAERNLMTEDTSHCIVTLYYSFHDADYLYLIMEYMPGGDLTKILNKYILTDSIARFYIAHCVLAIESIHKHNYIHRDIKPANLLLDKDGHLRVSDFGLCKQLINGERPAFTSVGTPNYMAPEVVQKKGHGKECDWWSLGATMYEMLVGYPPFYPEDGIVTTREKIKQWKEYLDFPSNRRLTYWAKDLICGLLCDAECRLGSRGAQQIKAHPWFDGIEWDQLYQMEAPIKPKIEEVPDTENFIKSDHDVEPPENARTSSMTLRKMLLTREDRFFIGYTYKNFDVVKGFRRTLDTAGINSQHEGEQSVSSIASGPCENHAEKMDKNAEETTTITKD